MRGERVRYAWKSEWKILLLGMTSLALHKIIVGGNAMKQSNTKTGSTAKGTKKSTSVKRDASNCSNCGSCK